jgi:hypothetical protein
METTMKRYIGVKEINAQPMNRQAYNDFRGWQLPDNENGDDEGFLVEYIDGGAPNTPEFMGYVSWSPKDVFARAYKPADGMTFGLALEALKRGSKVARKGWNGKGMWLILVPGRLNVKVQEGTPYGNVLSPSTAIEILPHIDMWTTNSEGRRAMLPGWLASQTDMLSSDWEVV